jgi:hypothetical protein
MRQLMPIVLLLCLAAAAPAEAKTVLSAKVCGANECETSRNRALIAGLAEGGDPVDPPKAYPASALAELLDGDRPVPSSQAQVSSVVEGPQPPPAADGGRIAMVTIGLVVAGALAAAALVLLAVRRRRRMVIRPRVT